MPRREGRGQRFGRRLRAVGRFGVKHRGSLTCVLGAVGAAVTLVALEGTVQLVSLLLTVGIAGVGAAVHHHQRSRTMHRSPNVYSPSWSERRSYERARRAGNGAVPTPPTGGVPVSGHARDGSPVTSHTRARPGQASQAAS